MPNDTWKKIKNKMKHGDSLSSAGRTSLHGGLPTQQHNDFQEFEELHAGRQKFTFDGKGKVISL